MGNLILMIIVGLLVGVFVISTGGGGGAIYLGVLTAFFKLSPSSAAATSIVTALPALILGCYEYYRRHLIDFHLGVRMLIAAIPSILVGFWLAPFIPEKLYTVLIGLILIALGSQLFYRTYRTKKLTSRRNESAGRASFGYGILGGLMVGIAGLSGGGPITSGLLILGAPLANASATSSFVLVGMSVVGTLLHLSSGNVDWSAALGLIIGSLAGAMMAPPMILWMTAKLQRAWIIKLLVAILIITMGVRTLFN